MKEHEDKLASEVEKRTLFGAKVITLMKENTYVVLVKVTHMDGAITVVII